MATFNPATSEATPTILEYLSETALYVNSGSGDDAGNGTSSDPLKTLGEALKNVSARRINGNDETVDIYLSGAVGDVDVLTPVVYAWPAAYSSISSFTIQSWDTTTVTAPAKLISGSLWHVQGSSSDMTSATGGMILTLTSSVTSLEADFGTGTSGSMAAGWFLQESPGSYPGDSVRTIAHAHETASVRIGGVVGEGEAWNLPAGAVEIYKHGATINFDSFLTTGRSVSWLDGSFENINLEQDTTNKALNIASGDLTFNSCYLDIRWQSVFGSTVGLNGCYIKPAQNIGVLQMGRIAINGGVLDGADHINDNKFLKFGGRVVFNNYIVFQNWHEDDSIFFSSHAQIKNESGPGFNDATVIHLTNSAGFSTLEGAVKSPNPTRMIGILNTDSVYSLQIGEASTWNWHSGSVVMQSDGTTEAKVSVNRGVTSGSADVANQSYILNYSSSTGAYNEFATDYSSSWAALISGA